MQRVSCLVGVDPDEAALDAVHVAEQLIDGDALEPENVARLGQCEFPELRSPRQLHFLEQALALMHRHAARLHRGPVREVMRQVLLIKPMPRLVQHAHEGGEELVRPVARGHAHVGGNPAAERVMRNVEPAMMEVEADGLH